MRSRVFAVTLLFAPLLTGQQRPQKTFSDCDKTAQTQSDLTECASTDYKTADDELDRTYQQLLSKAAGDRIAIQKIKAAERAWYAFRDAQIVALYPADDKQKEYGTVFPMCANLALADLTRERTKVLKHMLNPVEGDVCDGGLFYPEGNQIAATGPGANDRALRLPEEGVIPDETTAVAVAQAVFRPVFGEEYTKKFLPYHAEFRDGVWTVYGTQAPRSAWWHAAAANQ
jgi:uncharacterized protein YecT (DUF1311 family)